MAELNLFTSESVTEGHPDKLADQISQGNTTAKELEEQQNTLRNAFYQANTNKVEWTSQIAQPHLPAQTARTRRGGAQRQSTRPTSSFSTAVNAASACVECRPNRIVRRHVCGLTAVCSANARV